MAAASIAVTAADRAVGVGSDDERDCHGESVGTADWPVHGGDQTRPPVPATREQR